jgi:hypothetical protein
VVSAAKLDKKTGKPVIDPETGLPEIVERRVAKRDFIAREHDDRIAKFKAGLGVG